MPPQVFSLFHIYPVLQMKFYILCPPNQKSLSYASVMESHISTFQYQSSSDSLGKSIGPEFRRLKFKSWLDFNMTHLVRSLITSFHQSPLKEVGKKKKKCGNLNRGPSTSSTELHITSRQTPALTIYYTGVIECFNFILVVIQSAL